MATAEEIVRGLSQVMADSYDGATDENGKALETGLKRGEFDVKITDKRVNDGFGLKVSGNTLIVNYEGECSIKEAKSKDFETDVEQTLADVVSFVKKHYKKVTGDTLNLSSIGDLKCEVQSTSRVHTWVEAQRMYKINNMEGVDGMRDQPTGEELLSQSIKDFLGLGKKTWDAKAPSNVTRKGE